MLAQLPLILNPGYFSHDELQWWARADVAHWTQLPWVSWLAVTDFQYRPLTFNLWLLLAHGFAKPFLMHLIMVGLGSVNAVLLGRGIEGAAASRRTAFIAAILFVLTPFVVYTHGWTATLADLLTLMAALLGLRVAQRMASPSVRGDVIRGGLVVLLTGIALLCKESAVVVPAFLLLALYRHPRRKVVWAVFAASAAVVALYLAIRLQIILRTPRDASAYAWALDHVPRRLLEYALFPFMPPLLEVGPVLAKSATRLIAAALCLTALFTALASAGWRWPLAWLALYTVLLTPVLVLGMSYDHYAYFASAAAVGIIAVAWSQVTLPSKIVIAAVTAVAVAHAGAIMLRMRAVGIVQHNFYVDLTEHLQTAPGPVDISVRNPADRWMLGRFLSGVPSYRGVAIEKRVTWAAPATDATPLVMQRDGHLAAAGK